MGGMTNYWYMTRTDRRKQRLQFALDHVRRFLWPKLLINCKILSWEKFFPIWSKWKSIYENGLKKNHYILFCASKNWPWRHFCALIDLIPIWSHWSDWCEWLIDLICEGEPCCRWKMAQLRKVMASLCEGGAGCQPFLPFNFLTTKGTIDWHWLGIMIHHQHHHGSNQSASLLWW